MALSNEDKQWIREALVDMATKTELREMERRMATKTELREMERRINTNTADYFNQLKAQVERLGKTVAERIKA